MTATADGPARPAVPPLPGSHFYILSKAPSGAGGVLAIAAADGRVIVAAYQADDDRQLWTRRALYDGSYALINKAAKLCIGAYPPRNGTPLQLYPLDQIETGPYTHWRDDTVPGDYNAINASADWEQKINLPTDGPYFPGATLVTWQWSHGAPNELWAQVSTDRFGYTLVSLAFDTAKARIDPLAPIAGNDISVLNNESVPANLPIFTVQRLTTAYGFHPAAGSPDIEIPYHGPRPALDANGLVVLAEGDWQYGTSAQSFVDTPFQIIVAVPPKTAVAYGAREACAQLTLPYAATFDRASPDGKSETIQISGSFTAMCPYRVYAELENSSPIG